MPADGSQSNRRVANPDPQCVEIRHLEVKLRAVRTLHVGEHRHRVLRLRRLEDDVRLRIDRVHDVAAQFAFAVEKR